MPYHYQAYGIPIISEIELPALSGFDELFPAAPVYVSCGTVAETLLQLPNEEKPFSLFNENEFRYELPDIARYYIAHGTQIVIEPLCNNWDEILLYFYANGLAAALLQRNLIPFHVSGVFTEPNKVLLFAAPSRTGKSTTALMLQQKGYAPFTDDTALLTVENGRCYAQASYPMARLWQNTIELQSVYAEAEKQPIFAKIDKYGFSFHDQFSTQKVEVQAIVFLEEVGTDIKIEAFKASHTMQHLGANIYRGQWLQGMKKQHLQFLQLTSIAKVLPAYKATRPQNRPTFEAFAEAIENEIIKVL
jgi:hypothetical protein